MTLVPAGSWQAGQALPRARLSPPPASGLGQVGRNTWLGLESSSVGAGRESSSGSALLWAPSVSGQVSDVALAARALLSELGTGPLEALSCRRPPPSSVHSLQSSGLRNRLCETVLSRCITTPFQSRPPTTWVAALCDRTCPDQQGGRPWHTPF